VAAFPAAALRSVRRRILTWYRTNKRDLPWRRTRDPYRIWISEIMLQQTRVAAVIPYYQRFLDRFPDLEALRSAEEHSLLAAWAGLGYYSRARNLRKAAEKMQGQFPRDYASIRGLPGIGDYTAAAIASIAFELPHAVLDGNAIRVLSRLTGESGNVDSAAVRARLRAAADSLIDPRHPGEFNQSLMELGATVCLPRQPQCLLCPLTADCRALSSGLQNQLPIKSARPGSAMVEIQLLVVEKAGRLLAWQRPAESRRLAGFWELPERAQLPRAGVGARIGQFRHTIVNTNYSYYVFRASLVRVPSQFQWLSRDQLNEFPLSTAAKKALACLEKYKG
jgi:A/G-specific adenine glycosylase